MIAGLVLAAGASTRFGAPKQLAELDGRPLLEHALMAMEAVPALERIVVVLGAHAEQVCAGVRLGGVEPVLCPSWEDGQSASLRCGVGVLAGADAVIVTLGDQPCITARAIARFAGLAGRHGTAVRARATYAGRPGHPVALGGAYFDRVAQLRGDVGARELLESIGASAVECAGLCSAADVDTAAELEAMRT